MADLEHAHELFYTHVMFYRKR